MTIEYIFTRFDGPYRDGMTKVRLKAFVDEQGVPLDEEMDGRDGEARHLAALHEGEVIGTLRWFTTDDCVKVGRVAVCKDYRKRGIGAAMMRKVIDWAREEGAEKVIVDAQIQVTEFYAKLDFVGEGKEFMDAGIPHVRMKLNFNDENKT